MSTPAEERLRRAQAVIGAVTRQALADRRAERVALLDDGSPEVGLALRIFEAEMPADALVRVTAPEQDVEPVLHLLGASVDARRGADEVRRLLARLVPRGLTANAANKTALLLGGELPPEPLLPLGDLWASDVAALAGGWSAPEHVRRIVDAAGGIGPLDAALRRWIDARDPAGLGALPTEARDAVRRAFEAGRASRTWARVVPKLGFRTLGVDLHE
jgi:hypothetical protein